MAARLARRAIMPMGEKSQGSAIWAHCIGSKVMPAEFRLANSSRVSLTRKMAPMGLPPMQ